MKKSILAFHMAVLFAACGPNAGIEQDAADLPGHDHGAGADHPDGEGLEPFAYTLYTDSVELFVEFTPLIVGRESSFLAHFTRIGSLHTAVVQGRASVSLHGSGAPVVSTADASSSPGIFRMAITPKEEGSGQLVFILDSGARTDTLIVDGVMVHADLHEAQQGDRPPHPAGEFSYLKEQAWKIPFALERLEPMPFAAALRVGAEVEPAISGEQVITARSAGVVHLLGDASLEGMSVSKGQLLFSLSSQGMVNGNAGLTVQQARNDFERAKADLERSEALYADRLVTQSEVLRARNDLANAEAMLQQSAAAQNVSSGINGYVRSLRVREGQFVQAGDVLATIANNDRLSIHADVPLQAFAKLGTVQSARIRTPDGSVFTLEQLNGKVQSVGRAADGLYVPVRLEVDGRPGLLPGSMVEVWLLSPTVKEVITIPLSAVLEQEGRTYCFVQTAGETMDKRMIVLGANDGLRAEVISGLQAGERVVCTGAMDVRLATMSAALPAHEH